jgi:RNA recognition motif-containing protein
VRIFFKEARNMSKNLYIGNLPFTSTESEVSELFSQYGTVETVRLITDRDTGRPRGFGFVEMDDEGADQAIKELDGTDLGGRNIRVNEARPREERPQRW